MPIKVAAGNAPYRSDHMALSPDGSKVAVSASTGNVVHVLDVNTGKQVGKFASGNSPHENVYSKDGSKIYHASIGYVFTPLDPNFLDATKGTRTFQVVDASSYQILKKFNMADKLKAVGLGHLSPAVRPMAHTPDERFFYFQLSFLHGFVEYDMIDDKVTRLANLPNFVPKLPLEQYVNDAHAGGGHDFVTGDDGADMDFPQRHLDAEFTENAQEVFGVLPVLFFAVGHGRREQGHQFGLRRFSGGHRARAGGRDAGAPAAPR